MIHMEVDGEVLPAALSGHPALEFTNTWAGWNSPPGAGGDYLTSYDVLLTLTTHHGLVDREQAAEIRAFEADPAARDSVLREARRLRGVAYLLLTGRGSAPEHGRFARWAEEARSAQRLAVRDHAYVWRLEPRHPLRLPLLAVAGATAQLLTEGRLDDVHACPGDDCGWLFLDPRHRRRWCSMAVCGNRAKARAHARRGDRA